MSNLWIKNTKLLIVSDLIYTLTAVFIESFSVAYFLKVTNGNITTISIYYIIIYFLLSLGNVFMGKIIKQFPTKSRYIMSLGIVARALFIVVLSDKIASNYISIAIYVFIFSVIQIIITLFIKTDIKNNNKEKYSFREFINYIKEKK